MKAVSGGFILSFLLCGSAATQDFGLDKLVRMQRRDQPSNEQNAAAAQLLEKQGEKIRAEYPEGSPVRERQLADVNQRMDHLGSCRWGPWSQDSNPDASLGVESMIGVGAMNAIMNYGSGKTDRTANSGMIRYMADSLAADCSLYRAAFLFYKDLKEVDLLQRAAPGSAAGADIGSRAGVDLLALSKRAVARVLYGGNNYLALKVLALYGHDNRFNYLTPQAGAKAEYCQIAALDALKPNANSTLYLNGALGKSYSADTVRRAAEMQKECADAAQGRPVEREMCGEYTRYQADYYHVAASAFLHCAAKAHAIPVGQDLQRAAYLAKIREYKLARFDEEVGMGLKESGHTRAALELTAPGDVRLAKAILARYKFDIEFRQMQHRLGMEIADENCAGASPAHPLSCAQ